MTNIFDQALTRKQIYDFHLAHEMVEQALDTQDYDQSLRICRKALAKANEQNAPTWIPLFENLIAKVKQKLESIEKVEQVNQIIGSIEVCESSNNTESPNRITNTLEKEDRLLLTIASIQSKLKECGYTILSKNSSFSNIFPRIDEIACKLLEISQNKQVLLIIPLKVFLTEKRVVISEKHISTFNKKEKGMIENSPVVIAPLIGLSNNLFDAIIRDNRIQKIISFHLQQELTSQKTSSNGASILIIGGINTLVHIEPLIVTNFTPGFEEKAVPFAYQRQNNLHVVSLNDLTQFSGFIEKKIYYIETYALSHQGTNRNDSLIINFNHIIYRFSYPFIGFGSVFGFILVFGFYDLLKFFITIGYVSSLFYIGGVLLLYLRLRREKTKINTHFTQRLDYNSLVFNEGDLIFIREELTQDEMAQFAYECFGKANQYEILEAVEKKQLEQLTVPDLQNKEAKKPSSKSNPNDQPKITKAENKLIEKYSKFLED